MRLLIQLFILLPSVSYAMICQNSKPMAQKYQTQQQWDQEDVKDTVTGETVSGYVDQKNNFYVDQILKKSKVSAQLEVDKSNDSYKKFFELCPKRMSKRKFLANAREGERGNRYTLSVRFLPELLGYANDPYQQLSWQDADLEVTYGSDSIVDGVYNVDEVKPELYRNLYRQLQSQKKVGVVEFDMTNMDDLACDLIRGDAQVRVIQRWNGVAPLVVKDEKVSEDMVLYYYQALANHLPTSQSKDERLFDSGRVFQRLSLEKTNFHADSETAVELLRSFMGPDFGSLKNFGMFDLKCLADNMQNYHQEPINHLFNIHLILDKNTHLYPEN